MRKAFRPLVTSILESNNWQKLTRPTVPYGRTVFPQKAADQEQLGVRLDYGGEVTTEGIVYHKYEIQVNAGKKIPSSFKTWREKHGGTHAVMADLYVKKGGTKADVEAGLGDAIEKIIKTGRA